MTLVKSTDRLRQETGHRRAGLGLSRMHDTVEVMDTPAMRGMIHKVRHLVEVE